MSVLLMESDIAVVEVCVDVDGSITVEEFLSRDKGESSEERNFAFE